MVKKAPKKYAKTCPRSWPKMRSNLIFFGNYTMMRVPPWQKICLTCAEKCVQLVAKKCANLWSKCAPRTRKAAQNYTKRCARASPCPPQALATPLPGRLAPPRLGLPEIHVDFFVDFWSALIKRNPSSGAAPLFLLQKSAKNTFFEQNLRKGVLP